MVRSLDSYSGITTLQLYELLLSVNSTMAHVCPDNRTPFLPLLSASRGFSTQTRGDGSQNPMDSLSENLAATAENVAASWQQESETLREFRG